MSSLVQASSADSPLTARNKIQEIRKTENFTIQIKLTEITYNNELVKLLAYCNPVRKTRSSTSSQEQPSNNNFTNAVRGLVAQHNELIRVLDDTKASIFYESFVNWLIHSLPVYDKFISYYSYSSNRDEIFMKPIERLRFFFDTINQVVVFLDSSLDFSLKQSFHEILASLLSLLDKFDSKYNQEKSKYQLDTIDLSKMKCFFDFSPSSCLFLPSRIMKREIFDFNLFHHMGNSSIQAEFLLMNLSRSAGDFDPEKLEYDSLAICSVKPAPNDTLKRTLLFPPFRLNELNLIERSDACLTLVPMTYSKSSNIPSVTSFPTANINTRILIKVTHESREKIIEWFVSLNKIFPYGEEPLRTTYNEAFLHSFKKESSLGVGKGLGITLEESPSHVSCDSPVFSHQPPSKPQLISLSQPSGQARASPLTVKTPITIQEEEEEEEEAEFNFLNNKETEKDIIPVTKREESLVPVKVAASICVKAVTNDSSEERPISAQATYEDASSVSSYDSDVEEYSPIAPLKVPIRSIKQTMPENERVSSESYTISKRSSIYQSDKTSAEPSLSLVSLLDQSPLAPPTFNMPQNNNSSDSLDSIVIPPRANRFSSVPNLYNNQNLNESRDSDLASSSKPNTVYGDVQHASSSIDIGNFGRDFTPDFNFNKKKTRSSSVNEKKEKRKSVMDFFKKKKPVNGFEIVNPPSLQLRESSSSPAVTDYSDNFSISSVKKSTSKKNIQNLTIQTSLSSSTFAPPRLFKSSNTPSSARSIQSSSYYESAKSVATPTSSIASPFSMPPIREQMMRKEGIELSFEMRSLIETSSEIFNGSVRLSQWKLNKWQSFTSKELYIRILINLNQGFILGYEVDTCEDIEIEDNQKPHLLIHLNNSSVVRKSNALDIQVNSKDHSGKANLFLVRCQSGRLTEELLKSLNTAVDEKSSGNLISSKKQYSNDTIKTQSTSSSSLMSANNHGNQSTSHSSTLTSLSSMYTSSDLDFFKPPTTAATTGSSMAKLESPISIKSVDSFYTPSTGTPPPPPTNTNGNKLLLLLATKIRLHKQLKSYEFIQDSKSWETLSMAKLQLYSIVNKPGFFQMIIDGYVDCEVNKNNVERIGKAGMLVKVTNDDSSDEIYMVECKGKKEVNYLYELVMY